jgi:hypothetical protein
MCCVSCHMDANSQMSMARPFLSFGFVFFLLFFFFLWVPSLLSWCERSEPSRLAYATQHWLDAAPVPCRSPVDYTRTATTTTTTRAAGAACTNTSAVLATVWHPIHSGLMGFHRRGMVAVDDAVQREVCVACACSVLWGFSH